MIKLVRVTTVPLSLHVLLKGQLKYMQENGFDVTMVSADGPELPLVLKDEQCKHVIVPMTRAITPYKDLVSLYRLTKLFRRIRPDIVHSHTPKAGLLAMMAAKFAGVKTRVHTVAGLRFLTTIGIKRKILVSMERMTARYATHVWPNSRSLTEKVKEFKLAPEEKLDMVGEGSSNGINLRRYNAASLNAGRLEEIKQQIGYDPSHYYFLSVGRIVKDKGMDELSAAFTQIYQRHPRARLMLVGSFEDELDPVSEASRKVLLEHPGIIRVGWSNEVEYYMHLADTLVHPSYREGFPNVLLQAGALDALIICSQIEGNVDIVDHGVTGLICRVRDAKSLEEQMEFALDQPQIAESCRKALKEKIEASYDQRIVHELIREKYLRLLRKQGMEHQLQAIGS